jgi:transcriptional regulator with XRE-family HTH domain
MIVDTLYTTVPRPTRVKSPIRDLRAIIGKTQREFAFAIGISPIALTRIENNTLALSRRVARKIEIEAGVDLQRLLKGKLRTIDGQQYTNGWYEYWKDPASWQSEEIAKSLASRVETLLKAAVVGSKKRMWQVNAEILETLDRCRTDFNLERPMDAILAKARPPIKFDDVLRPSREREATVRQRKSRSSSRKRRR